MARQLVERVCAEFFVDHLLLDTAGIAALEGITNFNIEEALVQTSMFAAQKRIGK